MKLVIAEGKGRRKGRYGGLYIENEQRCRCSLKKGKKEEDFGEKSGSVS